MAGFIPFSESLNRFEFCGIRYYLYQVLRSKWFYNQIILIQSGSAQPQLPKSHFLKMTIPMPDLNTQHKIAGVGPADKKLDVRSAQINVQLQATKESD